MTPQSDLVEILQEKKDEQPWYKTYVNSAISSVSLVANVLWALISAGMDVDPLIIIGVLAVIQFAGVMGIKLSTNGVTPKQIKELEDYVGKHRSPLVAE